MHQRGGYFWISDRHYVAQEHSLWFCCVFSPFCQNGWPDWRQPAFRSQNGTFYDSCCHFCWWRTKMLHAMKQWKWNFPPIYQFKDEYRKWNIRRHTLKYVEEFEGRMIWLIDWAKNNNKACVSVRGRAELYIFMAYRLKFWASFFRVPSLNRHTLECQNILFILEIIGSNFGVDRTVSGWETRHWQSNPA